MQPSPLLRFCMGPCKKWILNKEMNSGIPPPRIRISMTLKSCPFCGLFFLGGGCKDLLDEALSKTMPRACQVVRNYFEWSSFFFFSLSLYEEVGGKSWHIVKATSSATDSTIVHSTTECNWGGGGSSHQIRVISLTTLRIIQRKWNVTIVYEVQWSSFNMQSCTIHSKNPLN